MTLDGQFARQMLGFDWESGADFPRIRHSKVGQARFPEFGIGCGCL